MPTLPNVTSKFSAKAHGQFQTDAKTSTTHTLRFDQSLTTLIDHFGGMPPIVNQAGRSIESMASTGVGGLQLLGGAGLVAAGAIAEVVAASTKAYQSIGDQVENYKRVVGASADESSRMVYVSNALGVSTDALTGGMFKLSKAVETSPAKLAALGIEAVKDAKGNIDLSKTLFAVADAYNATGDQAKKNLILFDAFGKTGKDMIPILEQGSAALKNMESSASLLFSDADLQRLKDAKIHTQEVKTAWDEFWAASIGGPATEAQNQTAMSLLAQTYAEKKLDEAVQAGTITAAQRVSGGGRALAAYEAEYYAQEKLRDGIASATQATQAQTAADDALWTAADKLITQEEAQVNAGFALQLANLAVSESQGKVDQAQSRVTATTQKMNELLEVYNATVKKTGAGSEEAAAAYEAYHQAELLQQQAVDDVTKSQIEQEKSYYAVAAAARKLQEDTDLATGGQKNATKETEVYIAKLQEEANSLAPDSPLRKRLQDYIDKLKNEVPATVSTKFITDYVTTGTRAGGHGSLSFEEGGRPPVGPVVRVGEHGPEWAVFDSPATIYPNGSAPPNDAGSTAASSADMSETNDLLRALLDAVTAEPSGQTGTEAALFKAMQGAALNRIRGMAGA